MANFRTVIYLLYQGKGQMHILLNTESLEAFRERSSPAIKEKIKLVERIKRYSIDSLGYKPTENFTAVYDQKNSPVLWVLTVSEPFELKAYEWRFPLVGKVSYKGFFKKKLAENAAAHFRANGYDVDMRSVTAWSTLGWFSDPILSNTLNRNKGGICNLFFHELFHATYYAPNSVDFNENVASFIAHKATTRFLSADTSALNDYVVTHTDILAYRRFMLRQSNWLGKRYMEIKENPLRLILKLKLIRQIADSLGTLEGTDKRSLAARRKAMFSSKNAYFIDFEQYDSMQDSLEEVFNKIYKGDLKKMVQDLRQKGSNY